MEASLASARRSSMSSRKNTPPSGCTSISCATNLTLPMGSWQSTGACKDQSTDILRQQKLSCIKETHPYGAFFRICNNFSTSLTLGSMWFDKKTLQVLGDGPHKQRDRSDAVRLSCQWRIHTCSYGKLVKVGKSCFSLSSMPFLFPCSERVCPCLLILQLESISTTCPGDRKAQAVSLEKNLSWSWLFGQGGLQKNNQCQLVLAWRKEPYIVFRCGSIS